MESISVFVIICESQISATKGKEEPDRNWLGVIDDRDRAIWRGSM
jgi:hypothetical protein